MLPGYGPAVIELEASRYFVAGDVEGGTCCLAIYLHPRRLPPGQQVASGLKDHRPRLEVFRSVRSSGRFHHGAEDAVWDQEAS